MTLSLQINVDYTMFIYVYTCLYFALFGEGGGDKGPPTSMKKKIEVEIPISGNGSSKITAIKPWFMTL